MQEAMRRAGLLAALCLLAAGIALGGAELYLRFTATRIVPAAGGDLPGDAISAPGVLIDYTPRGRRLVPGARATIRNHYLSGRDVEMRINSLGFRDRELAEPKPPGEVRVLVLGDSITWGDYLPAGEVYVERAERCLAQEDGGMRVEVINGGVGDIGLREEVAILREQGLAVEPDIVVVAFYLNDSRPPWGFPGEAGRRSWWRRHSLLADRLGAYRDLQRWMKDQGAGRFAWVREVKTLPWRTDRAAFDELVRLARYDWGAAWRAESWEPVRELLGEIDELSSAAGFATAVVALPSAFQVYADFDTSEPQESLSILARERGFAFLDLLPLLRASREPGMYFDHCHPTVPTNDLMGRALAAFLREAFPGLVGAAAGEEQ